MLNFGYCKILIYLVVICIIYLNDVFLLSVYLKKIDVIFKVFCFNRYKCGLNVLYLFSNGGVVYYC